ncbi:alpha-L-fucosidase [Adhaeribacter rhizoryzae]|uniref:alpha-L-fucosidase n=1 Tax=Adhaeribacter rhizoryzae TaxID=2607907 RepID=A0A5M6DSA7_9BACT|nr:alpha-L-fucosidase [Adhaeribacter rhizoryzae]KAA5549112.1 alpha-L-fucosidase [Adhaeribacter rhizoryzae]
MLRFTLILCLAVCQVFLAVAQSLPKPTPRQLAWQQLETTAFLHFTVNTYTDKEWGDGTESPQIFNPVNFDANKIVATLKETGFKMVIITAKHHDGFCLWPSKVTKHSVASSPWKNGKGDVVKEIAEACKKQGVKFGFYLSPWDQHEPTYGTAKYNDFYKTQLRELLTNYGEVSEVWFDGAKGKNAKNMEYDFNGYWALVRQLQPNAVLFSDVGPDVRWVGNESGNAGETCWSTINTTGMAPGKADPKYLNTGDPNGKLWIPAETDVSIRPGWFYHAAEDSKVKTGKQLVNLYYQSVGRNSLLLLNIPPNRQGLLADADVASLREFRTTLNETFKTNLLTTQKSNKSLTDNKLNTFVTLPVGQSIVFNLGKATTFDRAMFQENIADGQRNETALLEYWDGSKWQKINEFTTIGYKRLLRFPEVKTDKIRVTIIKAKEPVQLAEVGLFKASAKE